MLPANTEPAVLRQSRFVTFDGRVSISTSHQRPDRYRHLETAFGRQKRIARGAGLSYAAASFGEGVIVQEMSAFNRLLEFQPETNTVKVEAGITLERLLGWAARRNLYLAVLPGHPLITVGGCIAADVHGKNPLRDGTFCDWVDAITIYHPGRGFEEIRRASHPDLFAATCGGFGLTGLIVDATLRLVPLPAHNVMVRRVMTRSLLESIEKLRRDVDSDFAYSWHNGVARKDRFGQGVLFFGRWTDEPAPNRDDCYSRMTAAQRARFPVALWNRVTMRMANALFQRMAGHRPIQVKSVFEAAFPFARQTLYHRFFGPWGFAEIQLLVPYDNQREFVDGLTALVGDIDPPLVMLSLKHFAGRQQSLSMSGKGILFALDLARAAPTARFIAALDTLALKVGAQPNVSKDSRLPAEVASRALPFFASFGEKIHALDPERLYQSELSFRLGL